MAKNVFCDRNQRRMLLLVQQQNRENYIWVAELFHRSMEDHKYNKYRV